ncbi:MAG TPA: toll/interleukin-1 receptor domain-containing protein [Burkholderiales bacterium]|nr:toll/interleukin-1 receptor domain-containing protein [Burkholderiales bacterium]
MSRPRWVVWAAGWLLAVAALAFGTDVWQDADWALYEATSSQQAPPWPNELALIDVPHDADVAVFRGRLAQLAELLAAQPLAAPRAVVFDVQFTARSEGLLELMQALRNLQKTGTKIYAAVDPRHPSNAMPWPGYMAEHARPLYEGLLDGMGHTLFDQHGGVVKYDPRLALGAGITLNSLVIKVAETHFERPLNAQEKPLLLHLGSPESLRAHSWRFEQGRLVALAKGSAVEMRQGVVIIGSLGEDRIPGATVSGPEYLAWALAARAARADVAEARLLANLPLLVGLTVALSSLAAIIAWWVYRRAVRSSQRMLWTCVVALISPLLMLMAGAVVLRGVGLVLGQITLPALGVVVAVVLCALFMWRYRLWAALHAGPPADETAYDVFVSYSRSDPAHVQWVREHIVAPLHVMTHPDGRKPRVFFDTHEIKVGDNWFDRLLNAVGSSRCFLPVYSADYHNKHFCRYELTAAIRRHIQGTMVIVPVRCGEAPIPKAADGLQFVRAETPGFMTQVQTELDKAWRSDLRDALTNHVGRGRPNDSPAQH